MATETRSTPEGPFLEIAPALGPPDTVLVASPSKSATHRAILLGLLTPHTIIENALFSADTAASLRLATALGARTSAEPVTDAGDRLLGRIGDGIQPYEALDPTSHDGTELPASWSALDLDRTLAASAPQVPRPLLAAGVRLHIEGRGRPDPRADTVDLANSGTTLRIGTALAALGSRPITLTGDPSLLTRPMGPLTAALQSLGAKVACEGKEERPPVTVQGPLGAGRVSIRGDVSSQYITALLVAAQVLDGRTEIDVSTPLKSRPYVEITRRTLARFGCKMELHERDGTGPLCSVDGPVTCPPVHYFVPGDWSSAAFSLVGAVVTGGRVALAGLDPESEQGDRAVLDVLRQTGAEVEWSDDPERPEGRLLTVSAPAGRPKAFTHSFTDTPDLFPALAALAARCSGTSELLDVAHVRLKECDRVAAMAAGLRALELEVEETPDRLVVHGMPDWPLPAAWIDTHDDHRILMAFSMLALVGPGPLFLTHPSSYHVSYPRFRMDVDALGGASRVVERETVLSATGAEEVVS